MTSLFGFGPGVDISINFIREGGDEGRGEAEEEEEGYLSNMTKTVTDDAQRTTKEIAIYQGKEDIRGTVTISCERNTKPMEHIGIKCELFGQIELGFGGGTKHEFTSLVRYAFSTSLTASNIYIYIYTYLRCLTHLVYILDRI